MTLLQDALIEAFSDLRHDGFSITIGELLDGLSLAENVETLNLNELKGNLQLLWSGAQTDVSKRNSFSVIWSSHVSRRIERLLDIQHEPILEISKTEPTSTPPQTSDERLSAPQPDVQVEGFPSKGETFDLDAESVVTHSTVESVPKTESGSVTFDSDRDQPLATPRARRNYPAISRFPRLSHTSRRVFRVASPIPELMPPVGVVPVCIRPNLNFESREVLYGYKPISRLAMAYLWRYLRRPVADGPATILDIEGTISHVAKAGFFLKPVYRKWQSNHAHLVLLIDREGSMVPFHSISKDLVETAREESSIKQLDIFYFHNSVHSNLFVDERLLTFIELEEVLGRCTGDTSVLIVSDAGAARGRRNPARCHATRQVVLRFQENTNMIAWLNPMPRERWTGSSAEAIARTSSMFQLDADGFSNAIDVLQGRGA